MAKDIEKCTCKFCGSPEGRPFTYYSALFSNRQPDGTIMYTGVTEHTEGVCLTCRKKGTLKFLLIGIACLVVSLLVLTLIHNEVTGIIFSFVLFAGIALFLMGVLPQKGSDMLI